MRNGSAIREWEARTVRNSVLVEAKSFFMDFTSREREATWSNGVVMRFQKGRFSLTVFTLDISSLSTYSKTSRESGEVCALGRLIEDAKRAACSPLSPMENLVNRERGARGIGRGAGEGSQDRKVVPEMGVEGRWASTIVAAMPVT